MGGRHSNSKGTEKTIHHINTQQQADQTRRAGHQPDFTRKNVTPQTEKNRRRPAHWKCSRKKDKNHLKNPLRQRNQNKVATANQGVKGGTAGQRLPESGLRLSRAGPRVNYEKAIGEKGPIAEFKERICLSSALGGHDRSASGG